MGRAERYSVISEEALQVTTRREQANLQRFQSRF